MANLNLSKMIIAFSFVSLIINPTYSIPCNSQTFNNKKLTFANCNELPTLDATLHYTYNPSKSTFSMAYTALPPSRNGWVAWGLNPRAPTMKGAQALIAFKTISGGPIIVDTYNLQSYYSITKGPISYNVSAMSVEESIDGHVTIFATWNIPSGKSFLNQVWQAGPVKDGKPSNHAFEQPNLTSRMELNLNAKPTGAAGPETAPPPNVDVDALMMAAAGGGLVISIKSLGVLFIVLAAFLF